MKSDELRKRLNKNRTMVPVSIRMPEDVIEDLKRIAPQLGFSGYQPLIRAYIGQVVHQAEEGGYWAEVSSIPGCATQGESFEELLTNLYEAVEGCLSVEVCGVSNL